MAFSLTYIDQISIVRMLNRIPKRSLIWLCLVVSLQNLPASAQTRQAVGGTGAATSTSTSTSGASTQIPMQSGTAQGISSEQMSQLQDFLDSHPEVMQALKTLLAQQLAEQGSAIDEQSITDKMLYARLQSEPQFRADALRLMVNSGYITDEQAKKFAIQGGMGRSKLGTFQEQGMGEGVTAPIDPGRGASYHPNRAGHNRTYETPQHCASRSRGGTGPVVPQNHSAQQSVSESSLDARPVPEVSRREQAAEAVRG